MRQTVITIDYRAVDPHPMILPGDITHCVLVKVARDGGAFEHKVTEYARSEEKARGIVARLVNEALTHAPV